MAQTPRFTRAFRPVAEQTSRAERASTRPKRDWPVSVRFVLYCTVFLTRTDVKPASKELDPNRTRANTTGPETLRARLIPWASTETRRSARPAATQHPSHRAAPRPVRSPPEVACTTTTAQYNTRVVIVALPGWSLCHPRGCIFEQRSAVRSKLHKL